MMFDDRNKQTNYVTRNWLLAGILLTPFSSYSAPSGGQVTSGNAAIEQSGLTTTINQVSQHATIDWNAFNINTNESVNFVQPNASATALNRIHDQNPSSILGSINANGQVFLANPNGFIFGANSQVNTAAFIAASSDITNFEHDSLVMVQSGRGEIINNGVISSETNGFIGFFAPSIINNGEINSHEGDIVLSNNSHGTLYLPNSAGIGFSIDSLSSLDPIGIDKAGIDNKGQIIANGGQVLLSSSAIDSTLLSAINNEGVINVGRIENDGGQIKILASNGSINQSGTLIADAINNGNGGEIILIAEETMIHSGHSSARGGDFSGDGGFIETSGINHLELNASIDTRALNGSWGSWLIDPTTLSIGDGAGTTITSADIISALATNASIEYLATESISVDGGINTLSASGTLILSAPTLNINSDINTDSINFNSTTTNLTNNANITASGEITFNDDSNLNISGASTFTIESSGALSLNGVNISGNFDGLSSADDQLTVTSKNGKIDMRNMSMTSDNRLASFIINRETSSVTNANNESISISGDIYSDTFSILNTDTGSRPQQNINLSSDTHIHAAEVNFNNTIFNGSNSSLNINATQSSVLNAVNDISALNISTAELTLTNDISTLGNGISLSGGNIRINKGASETLSLITYNTGNLNIASNISSTINSENLLFNVTDGSMDLAGVAGVSDLTITNSSNLTNFNGDIAITGELLTNTNEANLTGGITLAAGDINFSSTDILSSDLTTLTTLSATGAVKLGDFEAGSLTVNSNELQLNGTVTTSLSITNSLDLSHSGAITLANDSTLTGNLLLARAGVDPDTFILVPIDSLAGQTARSLEINYTNQDFMLGKVGANNELQSFTLNGSGQIILDGTDVFSINTIGRDGISLLGNLSLELTEALNIDTSRNSGGGGNINLSGLNIDGEFAVTLDPGSANIYLGTIGSNTAIASLATEGTGNIELYGDINNVEAMFDFSKASAIILNNNITFGANDAYLVNLLLGDASINGNYDLTIFSSIFTAGAIGQNIALQNLSINTFDQPLTIDHNINTAGEINLTGGIIRLNSEITSTGGEIYVGALSGLSMSDNASLNTDYSSINLQSTNGDIDIASLSALSSVTINATTGNITNAIDDYISNTSTSTNISANQVNLLSGGSIGSSVASPIVINAGDGDISLNASNTIYIANLANSSISNNDNIIDNSAQTATANADILNQLKPELYNVTQLTRLEISNPIWQLDQFHLDNSDSNSSPRIYYSKKGWRLGNP